MRCLIRFLTRGAAGAIETRERVFEGEALTLGRATDQILQLKDRRVALEHARIVLRGGHPTLTVLGQATVAVNGSLVREARLVPGDTLQIGANLFRIVEPPAGFQLAFTFELDPAARASEAATEILPLRLRESLLGMRGWSWLSFVLVLTLFLGIPASGLFDGAWQARLRETALPADTAWTAGPLASVHHVVAEKCDACHERPFVRVRDDACLACHGSQLRRHKSPELAGVQGRTPVLASLPSSAAPTCTDCHREHDGSMLLISSSDATCATCHRDIAAVAGAAATAGNASDFLTDHPDFRVTTLRVTSSATGAWVRASVRGRPGKAGFTEDSGLVFEHDTHLDKRGIRSPVGDAVLTCADCHRPEPGGARMLPIDMQRDCAGCHRLDFDPADPGRVVPHGDPAAAVQTLLEYYSRRYLQGFPDPLARAAPAQPLQRPGRVLSAAERAAALEQARLRAADAARDLFERRSCGVCHEVSRIATRDGLPAWSVRPVVLTTSWMPEAHFDHGRHGTELTPCSTCHAAETSGDARDVLMPTIRVCRDCHAGSAGTGRKNVVASGCMTCHSYHRDTQPLWTKTLRQVGGGGG